MRPCHLTELVRLRPNAIDQILVGGKPLRLRNALRLVDMAKRERLTVRCVRVSRIGVLERARRIGFRHIEPIRAIRHLDLQVLVEIVPVVRIAPSVKDKVKIVVATVSVGRTPRQRLQVEFHDNVRVRERLEIDSVEGRLNRHTPLFETNRRLHRTRRPFLRLLRFSPLPLPK